MHYPMKFHQNRKRHLGCVIYPKMVLVCDLLTPGYLENQVTWFKINQFIRHSQGGSPPSFIKFDPVVLAQLSTQDLRQTDRWADRQTAINLYVSWRGGGIIRPNWVYDDILQITFSAHFVMLTPQGLLSEQSQDHDSKVKGHRTKIPCSCTSNPHGTPQTDWPHWYQYQGHRKFDKNPKVRVMTPKSKVTGPEFHAHAHLPHMGWLIE